MTDLLVVAKFLDAREGAFDQVIFAAVAEAVRVVLAVSPDGEVQGVLFDSGAFDEDVVVVP